MRYLSRGSQVHEETARDLEEVRVMAAKRAASAKRTGGNWAPVARGAIDARDKLRTLYQTLIRVRNNSLDLQDTGKWVTPAPAEWELVMDELQDVVEALNRGLKGRA
jgi:hypothetical protein